MIQRDDATTAQVAAADPFANTWLSANAGSGKTRVLTDRVARLLLAGTDPQNILCLTYTKAAASEMQNRLFKRLGEWAMMADADLRQSLAELSDDALGSAEALAEARRLFAAAIETPGGLKIQTIHSFCASILRRFPLEAGIGPDFTELDDTDARHLRTDVLEDLSEADAMGSVAGLALEFTGAEIDNLLRDIVAKKGLFPQNGDAAEISKSLGIGVTDSADDAIAMAFDSRSAELAKKIHQCFADQSATYRDFATTLISLDFLSPGRPDLENLYRLFLYAGTAESKSRNFPQSNHTKAVEAAARIAPELHAWMDRVSEAKNFELAVKARDRSTALHRFATSFAAEYETRKRRRGLLDFDDLIEKTRDLLTNRAVANWVLYRLDGGVDHILVDEAQDTSPTQWAVIDLLTQEFRAGEGAGDRPRTIFVVGDKKQSIYSFQGADPAGFDRMKERFGKALATIGHELRPRELRFSFRSSAAILNLVDATFVGPNAAGLETDMQHAAFHATLPGRVDLWPIIEKSEQKKPEWTDPVDQVGELHHTTQLARQIATEIRRMIKTETLPRQQRDGTVTRRPITAGDFLILVRRRSGLFRKIIAACKADGLDVAGADRVKLDEELAVLDVVSLLSFLAMPEDDLSLAEALRSPLFGWTEEQLYHLAQPRPKGQSLWEALRKSADRHPETLEILDDLRRQADFLRPYDLINRILIRHEGRRKFIARMGEETEEGLDALLSEALSYEQSHIPGLTGFLAWFDAETVEIKRQIGSSEDKIRIMTVHGAKGLEAPIVILPDTLPRGGAPNRDEIMGDEVPIWRPKSAERPAVLDPLVEAEDTAREEEDRRLLYVALTRAENWLIIAGAGDRGKTGKCWYDLVEAGLSHVNAVPEEVGGQTVLRSSFGDWHGGALVASDTDEKAGVPAYGFGPVVPDPVARPRTLSPSDLGGAKALPGESEMEEDVSLARGTAIHYLLEHLPLVPGPERAERALAMLGSLPEAMLLEDRQEVAAEACALLADPNLGDIFSRGLAEVDITAALPSLDGRRIHGTIDRLIDDGHTILAIDYKSNRLIPQTPQDVPLGLQRQMAAYRDALQQVFPGREVRVALLWTRDGTVMTLPDDLLTQALTGVSAA